MTRTALSIAAVCFVLVLMTGWWVPMAVVIFCVGLFVIFSAFDLLNLIFPNKR